MRVWFLDAEISVVLFIGIVFFIIFPMSWYFKSKRKKLSRFELAKLISFSAIISILVAFTLFPLPDTTHLAREASLSSHWQLNPMASISDAISTLSDVGVLRFFESEAFLQLFLNIVLFVPLGAAIRVFTKMKFLTATSFGLLTSLVIEITQGTGIYGIYEVPYRLADVDDLILNTVGTMVGYSLISPFTARIHRQLGLNSKN